MINKIEINNWKCHDNIELEFNKGVNFIIGLNGSGKTSIIQAINFALGSRKSYFKDLSKFIKSGKSQSKIVVDFSKGQGRYKSVVEIDHKGNVISLLYNLKNNEIISSGYEEVSSKLRELYGIPEIMRDRLLFVEEGEIYLIASAFTQITTLKEKFGENLKKAIGLDRLQKFEDIFDSLGESYEQEIKDLKYSLENSLDSKKVQEFEKRLNELHKEYSQLDSKLKEVRKNMADKQKMLGQIEIEIKNTSDLRSELQKIETLIKDIIGSDRIADDVIGAIKKQDAQIIAKMKDIDTERSNIDKTLSQLIGQSEIYEMFAQVLMKIGPRREEEYKCPLCESELARERYETLGKNLQNKINKFKTDISSFKVKLAEVKILYERLLAEHTTILNVLPRAEIYIKRAKSMQEITERNMSLSNKYSEISEELEKLNREQDELIKKLDSNVRLYEQTNADLKGPTVTKVFNTLVNKSRNRLICELFSKSFDKTLQNQKNIYFQKVVNTLNKELSRFRMEEKYLVHIDDNGIPNVEVDNRNREFTHLSSGERTATYILTRMLLNNFIAKGDFIILDEPFEHLDIDNKKYLRDFIADAYKSNYMEQVIITTIQETLTRAFLQDSNTHLLYLR